LKGSNVLNSNFQVTKFQQLEMSKQACMWNNTRFLDNQIFFANYPYKIVICRVLNQKKSDKLYIFVLNDLFMTKCPKIVGIFKGVQLVCKWCQSEIRWYWRKGAP
jgi:hypothetical protein